MDDEPPYDIAVNEVSGDAPDCQQQLADAVRAALKHHQVPKAQISVALVSDRQIAELNKRHLGHEGPSDVITFDLRDEPNQPIEGEIVVSVDTARREGDKRGHGAEVELSLYAVHGVLHLIGYDDREETDAARMHDKEDEILSSLGLGAAFRSERK
jgi:probable rRNA maturation factor